MKSSKALGSHVLQRFLDAKQQEWSEHMSEFMWELDHYFVCNTTTQGKKKMWTSTSWRNDILVYQI